MEVEPPGGRRHRPLRGFSALLASCGVSLLGGASTAARRLNPHRRGQHGRSFRCVRGAL